jgi:hypothetical protein
VTPEIEMFPEEDRRASQSQSERRARRRFDMRLPALITTGDGSLVELRTETQNVSARGVFFYLDRVLAPDSRLEVTLTFPPHVTLTDPVRVRFTARVLRTEPLPPGARVGVAAFIEDYEFLRSNPASIPPIVPENGN